MYNNINNYSATNLKLETISQQANQLNQNLINKNNKPLSQSTSLLEIPSNCKFDKRNITSLSDNQSFKQAIKDHDNKKIAELIANNRVSICSRDKNGNTAYHLAVLANNTEALKIFDNYHADIEQKNNEGKTPLMLAVINQVDLTCIKQLIQLNVNINATDDKGHSAIYYAIILEKLNIIKILIEKKADLAIKDHHDQVAIHHAIQNSEFKELITTIIQHCPDINAKDQNGCTAIHYAISLNKIDLIEQLTKQGANINAENKCEQSAIHYVIKSRDSYKAINTLLKYGININAQDSSGSTALHLVINTDINNKKLIKELIESGIDINIYNKKHFTALYNAILAKNLEAINILISHGADIFVEDADYELYYVLILKLMDQQLLTLEDNKKNAPLYTSIINNIFVAFALEFNDNKEFIYTRILYTILKLKLNELLVWFCNDYEPNDIKPNFIKIDMEGWLPIHAAAGLKNFLAVEKLAKLGADINSRDKNGRTVMHYAAYENKEKLLHFLLENEAIIDIKDYSGCTALYYATIARNFTSIQILLPKTNIFITPNNQKNHSFILTILLKNIEEELNKLGISHSIENEKKSDVIDNILKILLDKLTADNDKSKSLLHYVAELGLLTILNKIKKSFANESDFNFFTQQDQDGNTPLHSAAQNKQDLIVEALQVYSFNNKKNNMGLTALHQAVRVENNEKVIKLLLNIFKINDQDNKGYTPLHYAVEANHANTNTLKLLIEYHANLNVEDKEGNTAIHHAVRIKNSVALKLLLESGIADINKHNKKGQTALHIAIINNFKTEFLILHNKGADATKQDNQGKNYIEDIINMLANY